MYVGYQGGLAWSTDCLSYLREGQRDRGELEASSLRRGMGVGRWGCVWQGQARCCGQVSCRDDLGPALQGRYPILQWPQLRTRKGFSVATSWAFLGHRQRVEPPEAPWKGSRGACLSPYSLEWPSPRKTGPVGKATCPPSGEGSYANSFLTQGAAEG